MTGCDRMPAAASRGGVTDGRAGRGGGRTRGRSGDQGHGRIDCQGGQVGGQGSEVNDCVNGVPDFSTIIAQQLHNLLPTIVAQYDNKGGAIVYTCWIEKMESVQDMSGCRYFTFRRHLEELHVTWAHLEKKRTRLQTYTNISQDNVLKSWRLRHRFNVMPSE
ncbi:hypothetical protein Tco_0594887 [Tanacetum coccineum]